MTPTPTPSHRVRHAPVSRQPGIPATMRVAVEVGFVQSCPDCRAIVANLAQSCIGDPTVTAFRAVPGRKHAHDTAEGSQALPGLTSAPTPTPEVFSGHPPSDTNGSAPEEVESALFALQGTPNGFDAEA